MNLDNLMNYEYMHDSWIQLILTTVKTGQWQHKEITLTECEMQNNWLFYYSNFIILNSELLWFKILEFAHNAAVAGYPGCMKTYEIVQQVYYWPIMYDQAGPKYRDSGIDSWIDFTYKRPLNKPAIQLSQPPN